MLCIIQLNKTSNKPKYILYAVGFIINGYIALFINIFDTIISMQSMNLDNPSIKHDFNTELVVSVISLINPNNICLRCSVQTPFIC